MFHTTTGKEIDFLRFGGPRSCYDEKKMNGDLLLRLLAALSLTPAVCLGQATIEGHVELPKSHFVPVVSERYEIVSRAGVLATEPPRAVVYLEGDFPKPTALPTKQVAQKNFAFLPPLLPIEVGTKVEFPNLDDTYHNVFSYSPAKRFDLGRYPPGENPPPFQIFDKAGLVTLRCDIHEHMRGLILVLASPYFAITDPDGHYRLTRLPAGHFIGQSLGGQQDDAGTSGRFEEGRGPARRSPMSPSAEPRPAGIRRFRTKLTLAMMLVVSALTSLGLFVAQRRAAEYAQTDLQRDFEIELASLHRLQDLRNAAVADRSIALARDARIHAALEDNALDLLYPSARAELRDLMERPDAGGVEAADALHARFYRFLDSRGANHRPTDKRCGRPFA